MARDPRVKKFDLNLGVGSARPELAIDVSAAKKNEDLKIPVAASSYPIFRDEISSVTVRFPEPPSVVKVELAPPESMKVKTFKSNLGKAVLIKTKAVLFKLQKSPRVSRVSCRPPEKVPIFKSDFIEKLPITRHALDVNHIPYPVLTEYLRELAERNKTSYTNIRLVGIFDPIPSHLVKNLTLDSTRGILKFYIKKEPAKTEGRRIVRMAYARLRTTGEIVSATLPVT